MMIQRVCRLYEEVNPARKGNDLRLSSPWMDMEFEVDNDFSLDRMPENITRYPIAYAIPRIQNIPTLNNIKNPGPEIFVEDLLGINLSDSMRSFFQTMTWKYDAEKMLEKSATTDGYFDPVALYTILRREHYLDQVRPSEISLLEYLRSCEKDPEKFRRTVVRMIAHNYYVTKQCQDSIHHAASIQDAPKEMIQEFIEEERGHDLILEKALRSMDIDPKNLEYLEETKLIMQILQKTTTQESLFTSFCCLLEIFEGSSFDEMDPRAGYLSNFDPYKIAAQCLQKHHKINISGEHFSKGLDFLNQYRLINQEEALLAIGTFEIMKMLETGICRKLCL